MLSARILPTETNLATVDEFPLLMIHKNDLDRNDPLVVLFISINGYLYQLMVLAKHKMMNVAKFCITHARILSNTTKLCVYVI